MDGTLHLNKIDSSVRLPLNCFGSEGKIKPRCQLYQFCSSSCFDFCHQCCLFRIDCYSLEYSGRCC